MNKENKYKSKDFSAHYLFWETSYFEVAVPGHTTAYHHIDNFFENDVYIF